MRLITGNKIGNIVNVMIDGKLHSKNFGDNQGSVIFFKAVLKAKADPTDENVNVLYEFLNKNIRIAKVAGFEYELETDKVYMKGFNTPVPNLLLETVEDYIENDFPVESILNFWKLLMANPDTRVRESLFKFIQTHDFALTDKGYMIVYKSVGFMNKVDKDLASFVSNSYLHVKKDWGTSPTKYVVYKQWTEKVISVENDDLEDFEIYDLKDCETYDQYVEEYDEDPEMFSDTESVDTVFRNFEFKLTKKSTFESWDLIEKDVEYVGQLDELQKNLDQIIEEQSSTFTDHHSYSMKIKLGVPVKMTRNDCDSDPVNECSYGLHVGATSYVKTFGHKDCPILVCLINPMHVVAVPDYDNSKMRVTEYFPFALASRDEDGTIDIIKQPFFEHDYVTHEENELNNLIAKALADEKFRPETASGANDDERTDNEYVDILKLRVVDLIEAKKQ